MELHPDNQQPTSEATQIVKPMKLQEEVKLRTMIRQIMAETRIKVNKGWEDYDQNRDADNDAIKSGYDAHYHQQYASVTYDLDNLAELESGGTNIIDRRAAGREGK